MTRKEAIKQLSQHLSAGDSVTTTVMHVSRSGMMRVIKCQITRNGEIMDISRLVALATGHTYNSTHGGVKVGGCGMDMCFALVYSLGRALFPNGHRCTSKRGKYGQRLCPSNDHLNGDTRYDGRRSLHKDGGYALRASR